MRVVESGHEPTRLSTLGELFSTAGLSGTFFAAADRYRLFAQKVYPVLAQLRGQLEVCYCAEDGRAAVEPVVLLGVRLLQHLEAVPDRQAVDLLHYHADWRGAQHQALAASSGLGTAERKLDGEPKRRAGHGELSPKRRAWVAWVLPGAPLMAAPAHLATSAEVLPRSAPVIPPGSYQQK